MSVSSSPKVVKVEVMMEGYMEKRSPRSVLGIQAWQKRYFVLTLSTTDRGSNYKVLSYFKSAEDEEPLGNIPLVDIKSVNVSKDKNGRFDIVIKGRTYQLKVDSSADLQRWVNALSTTVAKPAYNKPANLPSSPAETMKLMSQATPDSAKLFDSQDTIQMMTAGSAFIKYDFDKQTGDCERSIVLVFFRQTDGTELGSLYWVEPGEKQETSEHRKLSLHLLTDLYLGKQSQAFKHPVAVAASKDRCFTVCAAGGIDLNLEGDTKEQVAAWLFGINSIMMTRGNRRVMTVGKQGQQIQTQQNTINNTNNPQIQPAPQQQQQVPATAVLSQPAATTLNGNIISPNSNLSSSSLNPLSNIQPSRSSITSPLSPPSDNNLSIDTANKAVVNHNKPITAAAAAAQPVIPDTSPPLPPPSASPSTEQSLIPPPPSSAADLSAVENTPPPPPEDIQDTQEHLKISDEPTQAVSAAGTPVIRPDPAVIEPEPIPAVVEKRRASIIVPPKFVPEPVEEVKQQQVQNTIPQPNIITQSQPEQQEPAKQPEQVIQPETAIVQSIPEPTKPSEPESNNVTADEVPPVPAMPQALVAAQMAEQHEVEPSEAVVNSSTTSEPEEAVKPAAAEANFQSISVDTVSTTPPTTSPLAQLGDESCSPSSPVHRPSLIINSVEDDSQLAASALCLSPTSEEGSKDTAKDSSSTNAKFEEVNNWLKELGTVFVQYYGTFQDNGIDMSFLMTCGDDDLEDLGVSRLHRKKMLHAIDELRVSKGMHRRDDVPLVGNVPEAPPLAPPLDVPDAPPMAPPMAPGPPGAPGLPSFSNTKISIADIIKARKGQPVGDSSSAPPKPAGPSINMAEILAGIKQAKLRSAPRPDDRKKDANNQPVTFALKKTGGGIPGSPPANDHKDGNEQQPIFKLRKISDRNTGAGDDKQQGESLPVPSFLANLKKTPRNADQQNKPNIDLQGGGSIAELAKKMAEQRQKSDQPTNP